MSGILVEVYLEGSSFYLFTRSAIYLFIEFKKLYDFFHDVLYIVGFIFALHCVLGSANYEAADLKHS